MRVRVRGEGRSGGAIGDDSAFAFDFGIIGVLIICFLSINSSPFFWRFATFFFGFGFGGCV